MVRWRRADLARRIAERFRVSLAERTVGTLLHSYDAMLDAWTWLIAQPDRIASIASRPWAQVNR